jgi:hypothetical protein
VRRREPLKRMTPRRCLELLLAVAKAEARIDTADRNGMTMAMSNAREAASIALALARTMLREAVDAELQKRGSHPHKKGGRRG